MPMNHQSFKQKYLNTLVERVDPNSLFQCMDLAIAYCEEVLGTPRTIFAGLIYAYEVFEKSTEATGSRFDFIKNTPWSIPRQGDVLVFKKAINGTAGHIVVVDSADINTVTVISQNDPVGSKVIMKTYSYDYVLGWLRKIGLGPDIAVYEKQISDLRETEKRLIKEKDEAVKEIERRLQEAKQGYLADIASARQNGRKEIIEKIMNYTKNL